MTRKADAVIAEARDRSTALINAIPNRHEKRRGTAVRVVEVCTGLLSARPVQEPLAPRVSEEGALRFPGFPAPQTLLNHYRGLLRLWRDAYRKLLDLSAPRPKGQGPALAIADADLASLDPGVKVRIQLLMAVLRETKLEADRAKRVLRDHVPVGGASRPPPGVAVSVPGAQALRAWLASLEAGESGLEVVAGTGVRVTRRARPGQIVIPAEVLEAIRAACLPPRTAVEFLPPVGIACACDAHAAAGKGCPPTLEDLE